MVPPTQQAMLRHVSYITVYRTTVKKNDANRAWIKGAGRMNHLKHSVPWVVYHPVTMIQPYVVNMAHTGFNTYKVADQY